MAKTLMAGDVCNRIVVVSERRTPLDVAAQRVREQHVGSLVVVDGTGLGRLVVGMLTDRDIVISMVAKAVDPFILQVEDRMSTDVVTARASDALAEVPAPMRGKGLRRLPVVDPQGLLVGLVSLDDLLEILAEQLRAVVQAIGAGHRRERPARR